jgi:hypothetical protein
MVAFLDGVLIPLGGTVDESLHGYYTESAMRLRGKRQNCGGKKRGDRVKVQVRGGGG